jgi:hypothetical protein
MIEGIRIVCPGSVLCAVLPGCGRKRFHVGTAGLTPPEHAVREIRYKATAANARFHTSVFQQRVNVLINWYRVLNARDRDDRFKARVLINDPGCCMPGETSWVDQLAAVVREENGHG